MAARKGRADAAEAADGAEAAATTAAAPTATAAFAGCAASAARPHSREGEGRLHPLTLFALALLALAQVFLADQTAYVLMAALSFLVLLDASARAFLRQLVAFACACGLVAFILHVDVGWVTSIFLGLAVLLVRVFPLINIGCALMLVSSSKLLACLRMVRVPNGVAVGTVIALRFFDEIADRVKEIKRGMRVRGLRPSLLHPVRAFELYFVPLVYKCLHVSETLVSSVISKGIERDGERTSYRDLSFKPVDGVAVAVGLVLLGVAVWA